MIKISKGLDLPISGKPSMLITDEPKISSVSLLGNDFVGMKPTMLVKENETVKAGQKLFEDKKNLGVFFTAPAGGIIKSINRGDKRKFLSCLVAIEFETVSNWALRKKIPFTTYRDLTEKPEVRDLVSKEIIRANEETSSLRVRKFELIPKELDHEDGELTATQKIKRNVIIEQFSELVESMYK